MPKVFISYGRDESHGQNLATETQKQLQAAGFEVFRDVIGLKPGDIWYSKLEFELESSDLVVLIVSEKIRTSEWVHNEISIAKEIGLPIIPVIAESVRIPLWLRHLQTLDFSAQADWQQLINSIRHRTQLIAKAEQSTNIVGDQLDEEHVGFPKVEENGWVSKSNNSLTSCASHASEDRYGQYADFDINGVTQRFRLIDSGTFLMGSPELEKMREHHSLKETLHQVTISQSFWMADTTCTQALWIAVMGEMPAGLVVHEDNPVGMVSWDDSQEFIRVLCKQKPDLSFVLPTEAQWEYSCRAGSETPFSFGENITTDQVNYNGNAPYLNGASGECRWESIPDKALPANRWGLYGMHGNISEWCRDACQSDLGVESSIDPYNEPDFGIERILRGGSCFEWAADCRSAKRSAGIGVEAYENIGFRILLMMN